MKSRIRFFLTVCCLFLFSFLLPLTVSGDRFLPLHYYPPEYERLTESDWPEFRDHLDRLRHLHRIADLEEWGRLGNWSYLDGLSRLGAIDWPDTLREEIAEYLLDLSIELLKKPGYLDGAIYTFENPALMIMDGYGGNIEVIEHIFHAYGRLVRRLDNEKLTELWNLVQREDNVGEWLRNSFSWLLRNMAPAPGIPALVLRWKDADPDAEDPRRSSDYQIVLNDHLFKTFRETPVPDAEILVRMDAPEGHAAFADAEKTVPQYVVGEDVVFQLTVRNDGDAPFSYDCGFLSGHLTPGWGSRIVFTADPRLCSPDGISEPHRLLPPFPLSGERFATLQPGEERSHRATFLWGHLWGPPVLGSWAGTDRWGAVGRYDVSFEKGAPQGWGDYFRDNGFENELTGKELYEGIFRGTGAFELIPPPPELKESLLMEIEKIVLGEQEIPYLYDIDLLLLRAYYLAPTELEDFLLTQRGVKDRHRLRVVYSGLAMFDTPGARDACDRLKYWTPGVFDRLASAAMKSTGWWFGAPDAGDPLERLFYYQAVRQAFSVVLVTVASIVAALVLLFRYFRRKRRLETVKK